MPHWETLSKSAAKYTYFHAVVAVKDRIYALSEETMSYDRTMLKLRWLDRSCTPPRLIDESQTSINGQITMMTRHCAAYCDDKIHFLMMRLDDRVEWIYLELLSYSTVTKRWSRPQWYRTATTKTWGAACQVGREIFYYNYGVDVPNGRKIATVYSLNLHTKNWKVLNKSTVDAVPETTYGLQWRNNFVFVSCTRLHENERNPTFVWKVSLFDTARCEWFTPQSSGTPPSSPLIFNAAAYENKVLVLGANRGTFYAPSAVYSFDLELYSWSTVACDDFLSGFFMFGMKCLAVNHLIYYFSVNDVFGDRDIMIHAFNMQSRSLTKQCMARIRSNALEFCRLPSVFNVALGTPIDKQ